MKDECKLGCLAGLLVGAIVVALLLMFSGCSQVIYNPKTKEIKVNRLFDNNELSGLEIVFPDSSYVVIDKTSSRADKEGLEMLKLLISAGLIATP